MVSASRTESQALISTSAGSVRVGLALLMAIYTWVLMYSYANVEVVLYTYQGIRFRSLGWEIDLLAYAGAMFPAIWLPIKLKRPSDIVLWLLHLTFAIPMLWVPFHVTTGEPSAVLPLVLATYTATQATALTMLLPNVPIRHFKINPLHLRIAMLAITSVLILAVMALNGFQIQLSLADVYDRRLAARDAVQGGSLAGYATALLSGCFAPLSIVYGASSKDRILQLAGIIGLLAIFSFSGTKSSLFTPLLLLGAYALVSKGKKWAGGWMTLGLALSVAIAAFNWITISNPVLSESGTRRLIISKAVSTTFYWEQFRSDPVVMADTTFASVLGIPAREAKTKLVGRNYGFGENDNYNANAWASAFGNFGYFGMVLTTVIVSIFFKVVDGLSTRKTFEVMAAMAVFFGIIWGDQAFDTSLNSSGVLVSLLFLYLIRGTEEFKN